MESCAELSTTRRQASSSRRSGQASGSPCSAASGSAYRSSRRSARAAARLRSTRAEVTLLEHVRPRPGPELAGPGLPGRVVGRVWALALEVVREGLEPDVDRTHPGIGAIHEVGQLRRRHRMIGAVHREQRSLAVERCVVAPVSLEPRLQQRRHIEQVRAVAVAADQVFRLDPGTVRGQPGERVAVDGGRHAAPDDGALDARRDGAAAASARCGRTCRAGTRSASRHPAPLRGASPARGCGRSSRPRRGTRRAGSATGRSPAALRR